MMERLLIKRVRTVCGLIAGEMAFEDLELDAFEIEFDCDGNACFDTEDMGWVTLSPDDLTTIAHFGHRIRTANRYLLDREERKNTVKALEG